MTIYASRVIPFCFSSTKSIQFELSALLTFRKYIVLVSYQTYKIAYLHIGYLTKLSKYLKSRFSLIFMVDQKFKSWKTFIENTQKDMSFTRISKIEEHLYGVRSCKSNFYKSLSTLDRILICIYKKRLLLRCIHHLITFIIILIFMLLAWNSGASNFRSVCLSVGLSCELDCDLNTKNSQFWILLSPGYSCFTNTPVLFFFFGGGG